MKVLAIYLPAFHQVKINDDAWGKGFVEWDNVKKGVKLYKEHIQPLEPYDDYYYDLSKKEDIERQIKIANDYKVDGFLIYHYWFGNGVQALEKPAQIIRNQIKDKIEYCFCWANHSWMTTWGVGDNKIIATQEYGDKKEWEKHIDYLIQFFKDDRYIKVDNRPMLYIYNTCKIPNFNEMIKVWNKKLRKNGLGDLYLVEYIFPNNKIPATSYSEAVMEFEPNYTTFFDIYIINKLKRFICKKMKIIDFQNYDRLWKKILKRKRTYKDKKIYKSCFVGWDNSPRKGKRSMIVKGNTPEKFGKYFERLVNLKRENASNDFVIINAWNEWSEGAFLEPSKQFGFKYLEELKRVVEKYEEK